MHETANQKFWGDVWERFDPEDPATQPDWRAERPYSPRNKIATSLQRPRGRFRELILGTVGTGKSTELRAIAEQAAERNLIVLLDLWRHFQEVVADPAALDHVQPWEVLLLVGSAIHRAGQDVFGHPWDEARVEAVEAAANALRRPRAEDDKALDLATLGKGMTLVAGTFMADAIAPGAGTALAVANGVATLPSAIRWTLRLGRRKRLSDQDEHVRALLAAVNALIGELRDAYDRPLVLIVDGLDRIKERDTAFDLFIESTILGELAARAVIVSGPLLLRRDRLASQVRHFTPSVLGNAPVIRRDDFARRDPVGIDFLVEVFALRVKGLTPPTGLSDPIDALPVPLLHEIAHRSGGRVRDFIRLIRETAGNCVDADRAIATEAEIHPAIDHWRRVMELGLTIRDDELMQSVVADPSHRLLDDERIEALLTNFCLLPFPNESEWYAPHPLLMIRRIPPRPSASPTSSSTG